MVFCGGFGFFVLCCVCLWGVGVVFVVCVGGCWSCFGLFLPLMSLGGFVLPYL